MTKSSTHYPPESLTTIWAHHIIFNEQAVLLAHHAHSGAIRQPALVVIEVVLSGEQLAAELTAKLWLAMQGEVAG